MSKQRGRTPFWPADDPPRRSGPDSRGADPPRSPPPLPASSDLATAVASPGSDAEEKRQIRLGIARAFAKAESLERAANPRQGFYGGDVGIVGLGPLASLGRLVPNLSRAAVIGKGIAPTIAERAALRAGGLGPAADAAVGPKSLLDRPPIVLKDLGRAAQGSLLRVRAAEGAVALKAAEAARAAARAAHEAEVAEQPLLHRATVRGGLALLGLVGSGALAHFGGSRAVEAWKNQGAVNRPGDPLLSPLPPGPVRLRVGPNMAPPQVIGALPGVGPTLTKAIIEARKRRPFDSARDFDDRARGVGPRTMETLRPHLRFPGHPEVAPGAEPSGGEDDVEPRADARSGSPWRPGMFGGVDSPQPFSLDAARRELSRDYQDAVKDSPRSVADRAPQAERVWDDVLRGRSPRMIGPVRPDVGVPPAGSAGGPGSFLPRPALGSVLDMARGWPRGASGSAGSAVRLASAEMGVSGGAGKLDGGPAAASLDRLTRAAEVAAQALEAVSRPVVRARGPLEVRMPDYSGRM